MFCINHKNAESQPEKNKTLINSPFLVEDNFALVDRNPIIHKRLSKISIPSDNSLLTALFFLFQFAHRIKMSSENETQSLCIYLTKSMIAYDMPDIVIGIEESRDA